MLLAEQAKGTRTRQPHPLNARGQGPSCCKMGSMACMPSGPLEVTYRVSLSGNRWPRRQSAAALYGWPAGSQWPALKADFVADRVEGASCSPFRILSLDDRASRWRGH